MIAYGADAIVKGESAENEDIADEDLEMVLMRGERQAKMLEEKVEAALEEKKHVLENFEQITNFFTFESTSAPVPTNIEQAESRKGSLLPSSKKPNLSPLLTPPHSPSKDTTDFTEFTISQTLTSSSVLQGSPIDLNDEEDNEDRDSPKPISRRRSPSPTQGTKKFRSPRSSKS